jgi:uncharacterized caspase-like protein
MSAIFRILALVGLSAAITSAQQAPPPLVPTVGGWPLASQTQFGGGDRWVAASWPKQVRIFDAATGDLVRVMDVDGLPENNYSPWASVVMASDPVRDRLAVFTRSLAVVVIDVSTGGQLWRSAPLWVAPVSALSPVPTLKFSADGEWVLITGAYAEAPVKDQAVRPLRLRAVDGRPDAALPAFKVKDLQFGGTASVWSDDGRWLHADAGRKTDIVEADSGRIVAQAPSTVVASHSASGVAITRAGLNLRIVDLNSGKRRREWSLFQYGRASFSRDGRRILLIGGLGWCVLDAGSLAQIAVSPPALPASHWAWSGDGEVLAGVHATRLVRVSVGAPSRFAILGQGTGSLQTYADLAWQTHANLEAMSGLSEGATREVKRWLKSDARLWLPQDQMGLDGEFVQQEKAKAMEASAPAGVAAAMTPDGRWLVVRAADRQLDVWDVAVGNRAPFRLPPTRCAGGPIEAGYTATPDDGTAGIEAKTVDTEAYLSQLDPAYRPGLRRMLEQGTCLADPALLPASIRATGRDTAPSSQGVAFVPQQDGRLAIQRGERVVGHLVAPGAGDWIVTTPEGLFDGSPGGWRRLRWGNDRLDTVSGEAYLREFYQPGLLADLVAGRPLRVVRQIADRDRRTPAVTLELLRAEDDAVLLRVRLAEGRGSTTKPHPSPGGGVRDLRVLRNGRLVHAVRGDIQLAADGTASADVRVRLQPADNRLVAYAFNRDDIKGDDAELEVGFAQAPQKGVTYLLAVGINRYANDQFNLRFAVPDAIFFGEQVASRQRALGNAVEVVTLTDFDATQATIQLALDRLAGRSTGPLPRDAPSALARLRTAQPNDAVIVYFAGHGMSDGDRFHLIPSDIAYAGPRQDVGAAMSQLLARTISDADLERTFDAMDAQHLLLVIDACQSGQALELADARPGPMNSRGLAQLAYDKGMSILTASQAHEAALESERLGHGYLTFALVNEGLGSTAADRLPADGRLTADEWFAYAVTRVAELQGQALSEAARSGRALRFEVGSRVQTPRVFARRDTSVAPFVVARQ